MASQGLDTFRIAELQALEFAASCFPDIGVSRMERQRVRGLSDATVESMNLKWHRLESSMRGALFKDTCPLSFFSHDLLLELCRMWGRVWPQLKGRDENVTRAVWIVAEHVLIPTVYLIIRKHRHRGLGTELQPESCWYLPQPDEKDRVCHPVQQVLDYWLRTAGFRTEAGLSRKFSDTLKEAWQTKVKRWRKGQMPRYVSDLHKMVTLCDRQAAWLDEARAWRTRFTLAWVCQNSWSKLDTALATANSTPTQTLALALQANATAPVLCDDNKLLVQPNVFFAIRLLQRHSPSIRMVLKNAPRKLSVGPFGLEVPDEEIERLRQKAAYNLNHGNLVVDFLRQQMAKQRRRGTHRQQNAVDQVADYTFKLGIRELNRLIRMPK